MFLHILDCPECEFRFEFDKEGEFPEFITCPNCNKSHLYSEYSAVVLCRQCRGKLKIPLDIINESGLICPLCDAAIGTDDLLSEDNDLNTYSGNCEDFAPKRKLLLENGTFFGNYKIIRPLGRGGMAEVYLAEHLLLKTECAIKVMRNVDGDSDPVFVKRFVREAKLSHSIDHPNIVKVFDAGCDYKTGYMFIAMEYVSGKTLLELANGKLLTEKALMQILESMASALKVLHENNVVHRDIKPSNIMRTSDGVYKLMDLGIAKTESNSQAGEMTLTMDRQTIGTPSYASPEQCHSAHTADIRSDIYSLGATLYHLASGVIPYDGTTSIEIILKVIKHDHVPLKRLRKDISGRLIAMIEQMMSNDPDSRPADPDALLAFVHSRDNFFSGIKFQCETALKNLSSIFVPGKSKWLNSGAKKMKFAAQAVAILLVFIIGVKLFSCKEEQKVVQPAHTVADNTISETVQENTGDTANKTAVAASKKDGVRTIQFRLDECIERLERVKNSADDGYKSERIAFINKQIETLKTQKEIRQAVLEEKKAPYSKEKTWAFVRQYESYVNAGRGAYQQDYRERQQHAKRLLEMFSDPQVDPNCRVEIRKTATGVQVERLFFAEALTTVYGRLRHARIDLVVNLLKTKRVDVNLLNRKKLLFWAFYQQGLEDVDSGETSLLLEALAERANDYHYTGIGKRKIFRSAEQILLLSPKLDCVNSQGETPMHIAAKYNNLAFAQNLFYAGFSGFYQKDNQGKTPWDVAVLNGSCDIIAFLKKNGFATSDADEKNGLHKLFAAVKNNNHQEVKRIIETKQARADVVGFNGLTAFEYACFLGDIKMVQTILSSNGHGIHYADYNGPRKIEKVESKSNSSRDELNRPSGVGATHPLHIAFKSRNLKMFKYLLQCKISSNIAFPAEDYGQKKGVFAELALDTNYFWSQKEQKEEHHSVDIEFVSEFIRAQVELDKTFNINLEYNGNNTLSAICNVRSYRIKTNEKKQKELVSFLISKGARLPENYDLRRIEHKEIRDLLRKESAGNTGNTAGKTAVAANTEVAAAVPEKTDNASKTTESSASSIELNAANLQSGQASVAASKKDGARTIQFRLDECIERLERVKKSSDDGYKSERIAFINKQIETLKTQKEIRQAVLEEKKAPYSKEKTLAFVRQYESYVNAGRETSQQSYQERRQHQQQMREQVKRILEKFSDPHVDPNCRVEIKMSPTGKRVERMFFAEALTTAYGGLKHSVRAQMLHLLKTKRVDVNLLDRKKLLIWAFYQQGLEDVDSGETSLLLEALAERANDYYYSGIGKRNLFSTAEQILLLSPKLDCVNSQGETPMHIAAKYNNLAFAQNLFYAGFNKFSQKDKQGKTPWDVAVLNGSFDVVDFLKKNGFATSDADEKNGLHKLFAAVKNNNHQDVKRIIETKQARADVVGFNGLTAFEYACLLGDIKMVQTILSSNGHGIRYADYNGPRKIDRAKTQYYRSNDKLIRPSGVGATHPLHIAFKSRNLKMFKYLLQCKISSNIAFPAEDYGLKKGVFAELALNTRQFWNQKEQTLYYSTYKDDNSFIFELIRAQVELDPTFNINLEYNGNNTLSAVCNFNRYGTNVEKQKELVSFLISKGARLPKKYDSGRIYRREIKNLLIAKGLIRKR